MSPEQFREVVRLFEHAAALDADHRTSWLHEESDDPEVIRRVRAMLERDGRPEPRLDHPLPMASELLDQFGSAPPPEVHEEPHPPETIGQYRILGLIGRGGMGIVYRAEQARPRRLVALKVIPRLAGKDVHRRFEREAQVLGALHHPNIAQVFEAGAAPTPEEERAYIAMELVEGVDILTYASRHELPVRDRLEMIASICDAVNHAHQRGVVHRDLKPHNILVCDDGTPKVLDFGVARILDAADLNAGTLQTGVGQIIGTIPYMSPEQIEGDPHRIDTRTDVYALGVLCFELLTGELPLDLRGRGIIDAVRMLRETEPRRLDSISRTYRGDVDTIVSKALERSRDRRYQSAGELGADIRRYLAHEPIIARPASSFYQLRKFARRNKRLVIAALVLLIVIIGGGLTSTFLYVQTEAARIEARRNEEEANRRRSEARWLAYTAGLAAAEAAIRTGNVGDARRQLLLTPEEERQWEWHHLWKRIDDSLAHIPADEPRAHKYTVKKLLFSHDGKTLWSCADEGVVACWNDTERTGIWRTQAHQHWVHDIALSPDQQQLATASEDGQVCILDAASGKLIRKLNDYAGPVRSVDWSPDGRTVVASGRRPWSTAWNTDDWSARRLAESEGEVRQSSFTPDGSEIVVVDAEDTVRFINAATGEVRASRRFSVTDSTLGAFDEGNPVISADGRLLVLSTRGGFVLLVDTTTLETVAQWQAHHARVIALALDATGTVLLTGGNDGLIRSWEIPEGRNIGAYHGHAAGAFSLAIHPDNTTFASGSRDGTIRLWDLRSAGLLLHERRPEAWFYTVAFAPDGHRILAGDSRGTVTVLDLHGRETTRLELPGRPHVWSARPCLDGEVVITATDLPILIWNPETGAQRTIGEATPYRYIDVAPDGETALISRPRPAVVELRTGTIRPLETTRAITELACAPVHGIGLTGDEEGRVQLWDLADATLITEFDAMPGAHRITAMGMSHDGTRIAAGDSLGRLAIWSRQGHLITCMDDAHGGETSDLVFSPDNQRLYTVSYDTTLKVWTPDGAPVLTLYGQERHIICMALNPQGDTLLSGGADSRILLWGLGEKHEGDVDKPPF
ncbi:MAG: protein kinase [Phycisphaerales bacterium]|nr:protein kinase [Phycisphaerales bacterium]